MSRSIRKRVAFIALTALVFSPALATDTLPLTQGRYVRADTPCVEASNATTISYLGDGGIGFSKLACKVTKMKQTDKNSYIVTQKCLDMQSEGSIEESGSERDLNIVIKDAKTLTLDTVAYRYCIMP